MNHLSHLFLAQPTVPSRVGNLLGDFARGVSFDALPEPVHQGLRNHWSVDRFTDQHPEVRASKALFSAKRRRFAGIALDVLYDHFLIRHWSAFAAIPFDQFVDDAYDDLEDGLEMMPEPMADVVERIVDQDWFGAYADLEQVGFALDRIAQRVRFKNEFAGVIEEIRAHHDALEIHFLMFLPALIRHVRESRLEHPVPNEADETWHWIRYNPGH
ncbi:acyl carrier protein phosphodiesterase [Marinobacter bohaiensis]|uniref:acyl carrier protein phosphodiesterase n=1 Tax=Marinobacter bohaiensis TaxID=2201898 RepID=UPI000DAF0109|nr:ACP phosphodiesterase [Marinobacter bohaiensis]